MDFDIKAPQTRREDFENYLAERAQLNTLREGGEITADKYIRRVNDLEESYRGRICPEDRYTFADEAEFREFLDWLRSKNPDNAEELEWTFKHEREHYDAVRGEPDLVATYCFWALRDEDGSASGLPAVMIESLLSEEHYMHARRKSVEGVTERSPTDDLELRESDGK